MAARDGQEKSGGEVGAFVRKRQEKHDAFEAAPRSGRGKGGEAVRGIGDWNEQLDAFMVAIFSGHAKGHGVLGFGVAGIARQVGASGGPLGKKALYAREVSGVGARDELIIEIAEQGVGRDVVHGGS